MAGKHRLKWAAKEAERQRLEEEERRRAFEEERRKLAEEAERRIAEEDRRRSALAEEEKRRSAEEERKRFAEEERMKIQAEKERLALADLLEKERRRAAEALASEFPMTSAGQVTECDQRQSVGNNRIVSKNAGKPLWWNQECDRARERYRVAHEAFRLKPSQVTSDRYHAARRAVDEAEQKAVREDIEQRTYGEIGVPHGEIGVPHGEIGVPPAAPDQKEGSSWFNNECREAKNKVKLAEKRNREKKKEAGYLSKERKIEVTKLRNAYKKVCWHAKNEMESKERGVAVRLLASEKKHITKLKLKLDQELKKGAANADGINRARLTLNKTMRNYEAKYGTTLYFDSDGVMKEVQERNPSLSDPPESQGSQGQGSQDQDASKTLDAVLSREAEEAPWWNEECREAEETFRSAYDAHKVHGSGKLFSAVVRFTLKTCHLIIYNSFISLPMLSLRYEVRVVHLP